MSNKEVHYTLKRLEETGSYDERKRSGRKRVTVKAKINIERSVKITSQVKGST